MYRNFRHDIQHQHTYRERGSPLPPLTMFHQPEKEKVPQHQGTLCSKHIGLRDYGIAARSTSRGKRLRQLVCGSPKLCPLYKVKYLYRNSLRVLRRAPPRAALDFRDCCASATCVDNNREDNLTSWESGVRERFDPFIGIKGNQTGNHTQAVSSYNLQLCRYSTARTEATLHI